MKGPLLNSISSSTHSSMTPHLLDLLLAPRLGHHDGHRTPLEPQAYREAGLPRHAHAQHQLTSATVRDLRMKPKYPYLGLLARW